MLTFTSSVFFVILCVLLIYNLAIPFFSGDKSIIWSPITMINLTLIYYIVWPVIKGLDNYDISNIQNQYLFFMCVDIFYVTMLIAFKRTKTDEFKKWNTYFSQNNVSKVALILFLFAFACYVPFRGFRYTIDAADVTVIAERTGFVSYFIDLISLFVAAACLALIGILGSKGSNMKRRIITGIVFYFTFVVFIVAGFRFRLVELFLAAATVYHLYPSPRQINWKIFVPIAIGLYLLFAVMDVSRQYGAGINIEAARKVSFNEAKDGAGENESVLAFSAETIDYCSRYGVSYYFEPIINAILMPLPRTIFPWKPKGSYMGDIQVRILGTSSGGAAILNFVEGYLMFGIIGVLLYGLLVGWLSAKIWNNFQNNRESIGAILLLALYNGFCYQWISRGYIAGNFNSFVYFVVLPFWLTALFRLKIKNNLNEA